MNLKALKEGTVSSTGGHRPCLAAGGFTETVCGTAGQKNIGVVFREE